MSDFAQLQIHKGDGYIVETTSGDVVIVDDERGEIDDYRTAIETGKTVFIGDVMGQVLSVRYVQGWFGRYSAPGYMDCTDWNYDTNKRRLAQDLRASYG